MNRPSAAGKPHRPTSAAVFLLVAATALACLLSCCSDKPAKVASPKVRSIVTSDTILSDIAASLLPPDRYSVAAILPPGQCPGHYDVKLTDIEKMKKASLNISFSGMAFMGKADLSGTAQLVVDAGNRNWMAPDSYIYGLKLLADRLSRYFPEDSGEIARRKEQAISEVTSGAELLRQKIRRAGVFGKPVIVSFMQKEPLEWMGFCVIGEYGRQEATSAREIAQLARIGRDRNAIVVVDNLQSGPDAGRGIAESLKAPHVVLTNFPSEKGYLATLGENVDALLAAVRK